MDSGYTFVDRTSYFEYLRDAAASAQQGDRIAVAAMALDIRSGIVKELLRELAAAATRRAQVRVWIDAMSFLLDEYVLPGPLLVGSPLSAGSFGPFGPRYAALEAIRNAGGEVLITNIPNRRLTLPIAGRSHIKFAVINSTVCIGGHNLNHPDQMDMMVRWQSEQAATYLWDLFETVRQHKGVVRNALAGQDADVTMTPTTRLLLDAGVPGQSIILKTALNAIDTAEKYIIFTCQYFPGGHVAQRLIRAQQRGVDARVYFSHPAAHRHEAALHHAYNTAQRLRLPPSLFAHQLPKNAPKLHAKLIATESMAIMGSHNFVEQGVKLGTAEIALVCHEPAFALAATDAIIAQIHKRTAS